MPELNEVYECEACGGVYMPVQSGGEYKHACPPLSVAEVAAREGYHWNEAKEHYEKAGDPMFDDQGEYQGAGVPPGLKRPNHRDESRQPADVGRKPRADLTPEHVLIPRGKWAGLDARRGGGP